MNTYYAEQLRQMNLNSKYGSGWIKNANQLENKEYVLMATGECSISSGRIYVAVPKNKVLTLEEKRQLHIM